MANIVPFRGLRFSDKAGSMTDLVTPPYDIIDEKEQMRYYRLNPYNIIRLEYGEIRPGDDSQDNRYTRAAGFLEEWRRQSILTHEKKPSVYLYEQDFTVEGRRLTRSALICGVALEEYESGVILPHEETLSKAKADRLELLRHCRANFSPIFGLYDDPAMTVENVTAAYRKKAPDLEFTDHNGETHRLRVVNDEKALAAVRQSFSDKKIFIADGHHRYETALAFKKERAKAGDSRFHYVLMTLVNLHDPGLVILPTHRVVKNVAGFNAEKFLTDLGKTFSVTAHPLPEDRNAALQEHLDRMKQELEGKHVFCLYTGQNILYHVSLSRSAEKPDMDEKFGNRSEPWRNLDVSVLQCLVLEKLLGIDRQALSSGNNLSYTRQTAEVLADVDNGTAQAVFFLNPTRVREVLEVAAAGDKMPQKSTYFYPKQITGLVINDFQA